MGDISDKSLSLYRHVPGISWQNYSVYVEELPSPSRRFVKAHVDSPPPIRGICFPSVVFSCLHLGTVLDLLSSSRLFLVPESANHPCLNTLFLLFPVPVSFPNHFQHPSFPLPNPTPHLLHPFSDPAALPLSVHPWQLQWEHWEQMVFLDLMNHIS